MDKEFHYTITGIIAHRAGFKPEEAGIIAYSSQYVDDSDVILTIEDRSRGEQYSNYISQTMDILKPKNQLMRIYPIFHFVPGDPSAETARRRDGKMHILNTTADSGLANDILSAAFKAPEDTRLYRIGIATHAYVDTWAHQNYVGWNDNFNGSDLNPMPNIGHAEFFHHPDWVGHRWEDNRIVENNIDNNLRVLSAANRLFQRYTEHLGSTSKWEDIEKELAMAMGVSKSGNLQQGQEARLERFHAMAVWLPEYDEEAWLNKAIKREIQGLANSHGSLASKLTIFQDRYYWKDGQEAENSHWFRFQEAVKEHQEYALKPVSEICDRMDVDIRRY